MLCKFWLWNIITSNLCFLRARTPLSEFKRVDERGTEWFWWNKQRWGWSCLWQDGWVWETKCHPPDIFTGVTGTWMTGGVLHLHFRHFIRSSQHGSHTHPAALIACRVWEKTLLTDTSEWLKHQCAKSVFLPHWHHRYKDQTLGRVLQKETQINLFY